MGAGAAEQRDAEDLAVPDVDSVQYGVWQDYKAIGPEFQDELLRLALEAIDASPGDEVYFGKPKG